MEKIPFYVELIFLLATVLSMFIFFLATKKNMAVLVGLFAWSLLQVIPALMGYFTETSSMPPKLILIILPPAIATIILFTTAAGKRFIDSLDIRILTVLHSIRMAIELVLFWLFLYKVMPQLMTFEGRNFDLVSGITAPVIYYLAFVKNRLGTKALLIWNIVCFMILAFTVVNGVLSAPTPLQKFGFEQPNIAVLYFPFILLPGVVVPIVYFSHLAAIRQLVRQLKKKENKNIATTPVSQVNMVGDQSFV